MNLWKQYFILKPILKLTKIMDKVVTNYNPEVIVRRRIRRLFLWQKNEKRIVEPINELIRAIKKVLFIRYG